MSETRQVRRHLTGADLMPRAERLAQLEVEVMKEEIAFALLKNTHNNVLKPKKEEIRKLATELDAQTCEETVDVEPRPNWTRKVVEYFRVDNGDKTDERPMTPEEQQGELFQKPSEQIEELERLAGVDGAPLPDPPEPVPPPAEPLPPPEKPEEPPAA